LSGGVVLAAPRNLDIQTDRRARCDSAGHVRYRMNPVAPAGTRQHPAVHTFRKFVHWRFGYTVRDSEVIDHIQGSIERIMHWMISRVSAVGSCPMWESLGTTSATSFVSR